MELLNRHMKKLSLIFLVVVLALTARAQNNAGSANDAARIALKVMVSDKLAGLTPDAKDVLVNKLNQIATKSGMGGALKNQRFILTANVVEMERGVTSTVPEVYWFELEITLYIGDGIAGTKFASTSVTVKGNGKTTTKAYIQALKELKVEDTRYSNFITEGKNKILEYYNSQCDFILKEASTLSEKRQFDAAIASLVAVPEVCKDCYNKSMDLSVGIYKSKLDFECQQNIAKAKVEMSKANWNGAADLLAFYTPELKCYPEVSNLLVEIEKNRCGESMGKAKAAWASRNSSEAVSHLGNISTASSCYADAAQLSTEISSQLDAEAKREWDLQYEKYKDSQAQLKAENNLESARIKAARDIGVAEAENQSETVVYTYWWW
jgi:hypothetical protein